MVPKLILANFLCSAVENIGENLSFHKLLNGQQSGPLTEKSANKINFYSTSRMRKLLLSCQNTNLIYHKSSVPQAWKEEPSALARKEGTIEEIQVNNVWEKSLFRISTIKWGALIKIPDKQCHHILIQGRSHPSNMACSQATPVLCPLQTRCLCFAAVLSNVHAPEKPGV
jgi:hypothetical protein